MRILTVAHAYPRWDGDFAGAFIARLVTALGVRGHTVVVLAPSDGGAGGLVERDNYILRRIRYAPARFETLAYRGTMEQTSRSPSGFGAFSSLLGSLVRSILGESKRHGIDVVHAHWWVPAGVAAWIAHRLGGPPYVVTLHGTDVAILKRSRLARRLARRVFRGAASITTVSRYLADTAATACEIERDRFEVQAMPVDVSRFTRQSGGGGGIVTVGRLEPQKRIGLVIDAVARLRERGRRIPLTIVGDGSERAHLERQVRSRGIDETTRFLGTVAPEQIPESLDDADVFVFPAEGEGLGLAVVEALMAGVPVIAATDGGGAIEPVPQAGGGKLVNSGDTDDLAESIVSLMEDSGASLAAARDAGARLKRDLDPVRVAEVFERIYGKAIAALEP